MLEATARLTIASEIVLLARCLCDEPPNVQPVADEGDGYYRFNVELAP